MSASVGDRIRQHSNTVDVPDRVATIVAVLGEAGGPPYRVRHESGDETIVTPGPDAVIEPASVGERVGEHLEQTGEQVAEKAGEVAEAAKEKGAEAAGQAARSVADAAEKIARRLEH